METYMKKKSNKLTYTITSFFVLSLLSATNNLSIALTPEQQSQLEPYNLAYQEIPSPPKSKTSSYILIDFNSGAILGEYEPHKVLEPASLTKIMTMYVIDKEIAAGRLHLNDMVKVSKKAWQMQGSRMFIEVNSEVQVEDLIKGIIVQSGNDASVALAEHVAGTEEAFVELMNNTAKDLGMKNTHFTNATGMPNKNHYTTAFDLALLSRAIIKDFPESYELYSVKEFSFNNIKQINRNRLLWNNNFETDGIKTGYTESAGYCLAASAQSDNTRLIAIVMGADSTRQRANEAAALLRYGFRFYDTIKIYAKDESIGSKKIWLGRKPQINVGLDKDLYITIPKGSYRFLSAKVDTKKHLTAPLEKYDTIGEITINLKNEVVAQKPLLTLTPVSKGNFWQRFKDRIKLSVDNFLGHENEIDIKKLS
jgi:D-alanyl-D-alanine carboxypeptidase (penicillin-binding protein 5/6)